MVEEEEIIHTSRNGKKVLLSEYGMSQCIVATKWKRKMGRSNLELIKQVDDCYLKHRRKTVEINPFLMPQAL